MLCMGRWMAAEAGGRGWLSGFASLSTGNVQGVLSLCWGGYSVSLYLTRLIFIHSLWRVSSDVRKGENRELDLGR